MQPIKRKKTARINLMVEPAIKHKLLEKAKSQGLNLTGYLERIAQERIVFLSPDVKATFELFGLTVKET